MLRDLLRLFPQPVQSFIEGFRTAELEELEEIRLRVGQPVECLFASRSVYSTNPLYRFSVADASYVLNQLSQYSLYAFEEELQKGYITVAGGHRVGLAGKTVLENGSVQTIRPVSSFNVRIARQKIGAAEKVIDKLYDRQTSSWQNALLIGPPQTGKTTVLRDVARIVSSGSKKDHIPSCKVGIVDERSEIAGCVAGVPQHELGVRVDVLDGCPKAEGMMMLIRSMSPDVLIVDEIGREEDAKAILEACHAGVSLIATAHGHTFEEVAKRPVFKGLFEQEVFTCVIELGKSPRPGSIKRVRRPQQTRIRR